MNKLLPMCLTVSLLVACASEAPSSNAVDPTTSAPETDGAQQGVQIDEPHPGGDPVPMDRLGSVNLSPERVEPEVGVRNRQRMDLEQLDRAMIDATGFQWTDGVDGPPMYEQLASTLGKPDFIENTLEDLSPSLLFHKFLDDGARFVCTELMKAEVARSPEDRIFLTHVDPDAPLSDSDGVNATLADALLRFHGRHLEPGSADLEVWRWLLENTPTSEGEPLLAWTNVCAGLITHPDFYAY